MNLLHSEILILFFINHPIIKFYFVMFNFPFNITIYILNEILFPESIWMWLVCMRLCCLLSFIYFYIENSHFKMLSIWYFLLIFELRGIVSFTTSNVRFFVFIFIKILQFWIEQTNRKQYLQNRIPSIWNWKSVL